MIGAIAPFARPPNPALHYSKDCDQKHIGLAVFLRVRTDLKIVSTIQPEDLRHRTMGAKLKPQLRIALSSVSAIVRVAELTAAVRRHEFGSNFNH
jgi:hypothetical protein